MTSLRIVPVLVALALPGAASAAKLCLLDATNEIIYKFPKLKVPRKGDTAVPVVGLAFSAVSTNAQPLDGTLIRDRNTGQIILGLTRFFPTCFVTVTLDDALSGTVTYDCNLDGTSEASVAIAAAECPL
jgi:hypothetical protein